MLYVSRVPKPPLDAFVASIWYYQNEPGPRTLERILPSGAAQLIVNLKEDQTRVYHPAGFCRFFGLRRMRRARGAIAVAPSPQGKLDVTEDALARMWKPLEIHPAVVFALERFNGRAHEVSVSAVTDAIGLSPKRLSSDSRYR